MTDEFEDQELGPLLPEDMRADANFKDIKTVGALGKSFISAQKMVGANRVALPSESASEAEMGTFYDSLGRPKTSGDYKLPDIPKELGATDATETWMRELFHKAGLTPRQAAEVLTGYVEFSQGQIKTLDADIATSKVQAEEALKAELGGAYAERLDLSGRGVMWAGGDELVKLMADMGLADHPVVVKAFSKVGKEVGEDTSEGGGRPSMRMTPAEAQGELNELALDKEFQKALMTAEHPGHAGAVERKQRLYDATYPEKTE